jgi:Holliday junction resolvasome RuvABC ATP-dependent DNA helicase subunit
VSVASTPNSQYVFMQPVKLDSRYTFEEFVVGSHNRFCHAAAMAVAENLGKAYNPLFIYGPVGLGKTHLMQAVGTRVLAKNPQAQVLYITAEKFMTEVIELLRSGDLRSLHERYRSLDLLLVDDIQFLSNSESTQEEFFHTFNALHQAGKQIIMTSDRPPKMLTTLEDRLRSRFEWGLIADIKSPNLETRVAILRRKESLIGGMQLGEDIRLYIAGKLKSNIRELEGFLKRIQAYAMFNNQEITLPLVKQIMRELLPPEDWDDEDRAAAVKAGTLPPPPPPIPVVAAPAPAPAPAPAAAVAPPPPAPPKASIPSRPPSFSADAAPAAPKAPSKPEPVIHAASAPAPAAPPPASTMAPVSAPHIEPPEPAADTSAKSIQVILFFPQGREEELTHVKRKFDDIIKKHKLKYTLDALHEVGYPSNQQISYDMFSSVCREKGLKIAVVLGPPPDSHFSTFEFHQKLQDHFDTKQCSLQLITWEELYKDYRYLNIALDITLIRFKEK